MSASRIMYLGASANAGKTVFTRAHCRLLSDAGLRVSPFKPVSVTKRRERRGDLDLDFRLWHLGAAARCELGDRNGPVQVVRLGPMAGDLLVKGERIGAAELLAEDTPLFDPEDVPRVLSAVRAAYAEIEARSEAVVIEGAGSCAELAGVTDPANTFAASVAAPAAVLVAGAHSGGSIAGLWGTWHRMDPRLRGSIVGIALNDVRAGAGLLEKRAGELADEIGTAYLGALPHCEIYDDVPTGESSSLCDTEAEYDYVARQFNDHIDVAAIDRAAGVGA
ncbi:AAA family ATPase [Glycomyces buryatensis]|uniref:Cobyric acid synthase n=1 Tax=Glycomyces buryatensis TaxID=2570927 RepID=A0A4S8Q0N3_9ACTN|nr:AAA family ATPase [Glycomyces buryatensis]THV37623.1 hypothetical protein FAB82_20310 [Glycomyces buryatensis]